MFASSILHSHRPPHCFAGIARDLTFNKLTVLPKLDFSPLASVASLFVSENILTLSITDLGFHRNASFNQITIVKNATFDSIPLLSLLIL